MTAPRKSLREEPRKTEDFTYTPPNDFDISEEVRQHFYEQGYYLRWIRISLGGQDDLKNISTRLKEGYTFISRDELSKVDGIFSNALEGRELRDQELLTVGDLALAKVLIGRAEARQAFYENRHREIDEGVDQALMKQSNRLTPISIDSRDSKVSTGKKASFASDE